MTLVCIAASIAPAPTANAQGIYEPVELVRRERELLIEPSDQFAEQFRRRSMLYGDEEVLALVRSIGEELAPEPTDDYMDYRFFVLRDPSPNAFGLPNGHIYVHTGMLARIENEAQLAAVLAHEIVHVAGHHLILARRGILGGGILSGIRAGFAEMFDGLGPASGQSLLGGVMSLVRLTDEHEREAIERARRLLEENGYAPDAADELLRVLALDFERHSPRIPSFWTPPAVDADPDESTPESPGAVGGAPAVGRNRDSYDGIALPLRVLTVQDYLRDDYPYTALAYVEQLIERYPDEIELRVLRGDAYLGLLWRPEGANPRDMANLREGAEFADVTAFLSGFQMAFEYFTDNPRMLVAQGYSPSDRIWIGPWVRSVLDAAYDGEEDLSDTELAILRAFEQNTASARDTYAAIVETHPDYARTYRSVGELNELLGLPREAAAAYLDYLRLSLDAPDRQVIVSRLTELRDQLQQ